MTDDRTRQITRLNDELRITLQGGKVFATNGIRALGDKMFARILNEVRHYNNFTPDNGPYGALDFGNIEVEGHKVFWKIDYYEPDMEGGSEDPADPSQTVRVLTIMLAREY